MTAKHVLVIGGPDFPLDKIESLGLRYSMVQWPALVAARQYRAAARYAVLDYTDPGELLPLARAWHGIDPFAAVVSFTEYGLEPASRCAAALGVPGDNLPAVLATRDKIRTRELLAEHALSPVRHRVCATIEDAHTFLREQAGAPIVIKPHDRGLSEGVYLVRDERELADRWALTTAAAQSGTVLAEEYLSGPEYSVESLSLPHGGEGRILHEVLMVTEKQTTPPPRFVEVGHQAPARLTPGERDEVAELVRRFLDLIGQRVGPVHTEIRLTGRGPRLIESQTRAGGDQVWELCQLVTGVDLVAETVAALAGVPAPPRAPAAAAAAVRFFDYEDVRVREVSGLEEAATAPGVVRLACTLAAGQALDSLRSSASRQGYVLCTGGDTADAVARAENARDLVKVVTEPLIDTAADPVVDPRVDPHADPLAEPRP